MDNNKTILIVDDDNRNTFALKAVLSSKGHNCRIASDGIECIRQMKSSTDIGLLLLDMMMPGMDGYEVLGKLRQEEQFIDFPIIAVTAKAMAGDREKCMEAGATDYISKPVDVDDLMGIINKFI
jgi:two-component system cell cycle response regulator DivK